MPYIKQSLRRDILPSVLLLCKTIRKVTERNERIGAINYAITTLLVKSLVPTPGVRISYRDYNEIIGVLECAKLEFYRRAVARYEDTKINENGDVYAK